MSESSSRFKEGDLVEYVGPEDDDPYWPRLGERGTLIDFDPSGEWTVSWARITIVVPESLIRLAQGTETLPND